MKYRNPETGEIWDSETGQITPPETPVQPQIQAPEGFSQGEDPQLRGLGLGTRDVVTGLAGIPTMLGDATNTLLNQIPGVNLQMPSQMLQQGLTDIGLPQAETKQERLVSAGVQGASGALSGYGAAKTGSGAISTLLQQKPGTQVISGGAAGLSSQGAAEAGYGPVAQMGAGLIGGVAPAAVTPLGQVGLNAVRGTPDLVRPFYGSGREDIAGRVLREHATDPNVVIPDDTGLLTTGQATRDMGLRSLEKTAKGLDDVAFAEREIAQNQRNINLLGDVAGTADDLKALRTARETATAPLREAAIKGQRGPVATQRVEDEINRILNTEAGERDVVNSVLVRTRDKLRDGDENLKTDVNRLYGIRKDINDKIGGKGDDPSSRYAKRELIRVRDALDAEIEAVSPGWRQYLDEYSTRSTEIDQIETLQNLQQNTVNAVPNVTGTGVTPVINRSKWHTQVRKRMNELELTDDQNAVLNEITSDLDITASPPGLRQAGSDTFRNMSSANVLGNITNPAIANSPAAQTLISPLRWLYKLPDEQISDLIVEAMLDPSMARRLMNRPTVRNMRAISYDLKNRAAAAGYGTATGLMGEQDGY